MFQLLISCPPSFEVGHTLFFKRCAKSLKMIFWQTFFRQSPDFAIMSERTSRAAMSKCPPGTTTLESQLRQRLAIKPQNGKR